MFNHSLNFTNKKYSNITVSSKYVWNIKGESGKSPIIEWDIVKKKITRVYSSGYNNCILCLKREWNILEFFQHNELINKKVNRFLSVDVWTHFFFVISHPFWLQDEVSPYL